MMNILYQAKKYNEITNELLKKLYAEKENQNIVVSPFSIYMLMAIAADATQDETRDEIIKALTRNLTFDEAMELVRWLQDALTNNNALTSCNAICVSHSIEDSILKEYPEHLRQSLKGEVFTSEDIVTDVNNWANKNTNGLIDKIADDTMANMLLCMLNATAFVGEWTQTYTEFDIEEFPFHNSDGTTSQVDMIDTTENEYIEDDFYTGFVKPYKDIGYSFMALLPKDESLMMLDDLSFSDLFVNRKEEQVFVTMPEFTYSFDEDLTSFCESIGIHQIFTDQANFYPLTTLQLSVDAIVHKARIEVNREGTRAAAVTMSALRSGPVFFDRKEVNLDRPFVYAIMHNETGIPVFTGIVNQL